MSKREQILNTTLELITELGFHATPMSSIIKKSNVAAGTIYYHFKSKEELIDTLYSDLKEEMGKAIIQNLNQDHSYKEKFFLLWNNLYSFFTDNPKKFEFLEDYANSPQIHKEIKEINRRHYQEALDFIESGIQVGMLRKLPLILLVNTVFGNVSTFARMIIMDEIEYSDELLNKMIQSSWDSVKIN